MEDILVPIFVCGTLFVGMPWVILHYVTKWKQAPKITNEDEKLLDELYSLARRLEDRLGTVERIIAADHPEWRVSMPLAEPTVQSHPNPSYDITRRN
ncbi:MULTISPECIES: envelope stress response membrane protein PspB [Sphingomonas]|uniref:envelope stress response membrane protein PspB n=1 Tax=Sphingomonas TaxID=13687 RepID=UPI002413870E|nr:envelope stress response membrane protein PspB [Sphingomonas echinoides]